jgi:aspartate dehydrogenase
MSKLEQIVIIGFGAIGRLVYEGLDGEVAAVVVRETHPGGPGSGTRVVSSLAELAGTEVDLVVECAGHEAVRLYAEEALARGADFMVIATGALVDDAFRERLVEAARASGARLLVPAGAIAGLDGLTALRRGGLDRVLYVSAKPPHAWKGTPAEESVALDRLERATVFFDGPARDAARLYPQNANLAATVAFAGLGLDDTRVQLVADPSLRENVGRVEAEGALGVLRLEYSGRAMPDNPKTSVVTAHNMVHAILNRSSAFVI